MRIVFKVMESEKRKRARPQEESGQKMLRVAAEERGIGWREMGHIALDRKI